MSWFKGHSLYVFLPAFILLGILAMIREISGSLPPLNEEGNFAGTVAHRPSEYPQALRVASAQGLTRDTVVSATPISAKNWRCSRCHEKETNDTVRRKMEDEHTDISLHHGEHLWCLDCHDSDDRDKLRLASGERIGFERSPEICGQCHGDKYGDWRRGIHGKRTGYWNGSKRVLACIACHSPHSPRFKPLKPLPPPVRPEFLRQAHSGKEPLR